MSQRLKEAREAAYLADRDLDRVLRAEYPVDAPVAWVRYGHVRTGFVTRHATIGDRIEVHNPATNTTYWIYSYNIVEAMK